MKAILEEQRCLAAADNASVCWELQALRSQWIRGGEGFLILYSITDRASFDEVGGFRKQILQVKDVNDSDAPPMGTCSLCERDAEDAGEGLTVDVGCSAGGQQV